MLFLLLIYLPSKMLYLLYQINEILKNLVTLPVKIQLINNINYLKKITGNENNVL